MRKNKIFISYSHKDCEIVEKISEILKKNNYEVINHFDYNHYKQNDYYINSNISMIIEKNRIRKNFKDVFKGADILLAVISENYIHSDFAQVEMGYWVFTLKKPLFAIEIGNLLLPLYINSIERFEYKLNSFSDFDSHIFLKKMSKLDFSHQELRKNISISKKEKRESLENNISGRIEFLKNALSENRLTLVCGAGVSASAGMPDWNTLLTRILNRALPSKYEKIDHDDLRELLSSSNLIVGKYLKILLKDEFDETVHKSLYCDETCINNSKLINNIIELIRPKRNKGSVESVINFNFDSILEDLLSKNSIKFSVVYDEGVKFEADEIPIYHVHGYLPKSETIKNHNLVFSEDGYHTQFIDPYSWSNLIQLYKYMNNSCLFIGVSLLDPNLRRILDISKRKNGDGINKHFIIKQMPSQESSVYDLQIQLEEQDALMLGLNVIWVSDFDEYPEILEKLLE